MFEITQFRYFSLICSLLLKDLNFIFILKSEMTFAMSVTNDSLQQNPKTPSGIERIIQGITEHNKHTRRAQQEKKQLDHNKLKIPRRAQQTDRHTDTMNINKNITAQSKSKQ